MEQAELPKIGEAILFVSGEPVETAELERALEVTTLELSAALDELDALAAMGCHAAILGKSVYTGAIDLAEAVRRFPQ